MLAWLDVPRGKAGADGRPAAVAYLRESVALPGQESSDGSVASMSDSSKNKGPSDPAPPPSDSPPALKVFRDKAQEGLIRKAIELPLTNAGTALAAALLSHGIPAGVAAAFAFLWTLMSFAGAAGAAGAAFQKLKGHPDPRVRNAASWGAAVIDGGDGTDEAWQEFLRRSEAPEARHALYESFKAAADVLDEDVAACLGALGRMYAAEGRKRDRLFLSCAGVLPKIDREDLEAMRVVLARAVEVMRSAGLGPDDTDGLYLMEALERVGSTHATGSGIELQAARSTDPTAPPVYVELSDALRVQRRLAEALLGVVDDRANAPARDVYRLATVLGAR